MTASPGRARRFRSGIGDDAVQFSDDITLTPALSKEDGGAMSAYSVFFRAGAVAELPAPYSEIWVVLSGLLRVGTEGDFVTAQSGDFVHIPEQAPGNVEALEDTTLVAHHDEAWGAGGVTSLRKA